MFSFHFRSSFSFLFFALVWCSWQSLAPSAKLWSRVILHSYVWIYSSIIYLFFPLVFFLRGMFMSDERWSSCCTLSGGKRDSSSVYRRFAPRAAFAARYACSGRKNRNIMWSGRGPRLILGANWRLENAKSPAAMLQENNPDTTCMSIPRMYLVSCTCDVHICLSQRLWLQSFCL